VLLCVSMGGAIAVHLASRQKLSSLAGLVVIDVVEGVDNFLLCCYISADLDEVRSNKFCSDKFPKGLLVAVVVVVAAAVAACCLLLLL